MITDSRLLFGASYYPQHYEESSWERDFKTMKQAGVNALRVGDFAWGRLQPQKDRWTFEWLDRWLDQAAAHNIGVLLVPPIRCAPSWLVEQAPEIQIINEEGVRLEFGSRYTFCINHAPFREAGLEVARRLGTRYGTHPAVIGWHLDNEYGDEPDCHCDVCKAKWQQHLTNRYGTIEALNEAWGSVFWTLEWNHFGQIPTPRLTKTYHHPALLMAWRRFRSDCTIELLHLQREATLEGTSQSGGQPKYFTTNLQAGWNPRTDYFDLRDDLDITGVNYYPPYGPGYRDNSLGLAVVRGVLGTNFQLHELRNGPHTVPGRENNTPAPGEVERLTLHCIGHGADAIFYFQWRGVPFGPEQSHGTPTGYDGEPLRIYQEVQRTGLRLKEIAAQLENTRVESGIALLYDFATRWSLMGNTEWGGPPSLYMDHARRIYNAIRTTGANCDAIGRDSDFEAYKILVVPMLEGMDEELVAKLCAFVERGGTLLWHPFSGTKNRDMCHYPRRLHPQLEKLFGLSVRDVATGAEAAFSLEWRGQTYTGGWFSDLPVVTTAQTLATFTNDWFEGTPALCENKWGEGRAIYLTTFAEPNFYRDFLAPLTKGNDLQPPFEAPPAIEIIERTSDTHRLFFLLNGTSQKQTMKLPHPHRDIWNDEECAGEVEFAPHQCRIFTLPRYL